MTAVQVRNSQGNVIAVVEGADLREADRKARHVPGAASVELLTVVSGQSYASESEAAVAKFDAIKLREDRGASIEAQLEESFKRLGLPVDQAKVAAGGRAGRRSDVPRRTVEAAPSAPRTVTTRLESAFKRMGLGEAAAKIAAAGRR